MRATTYRSKDMDKSYDELMQQAGRIVTMIDERGGFKACGRTRQEIYIMAASVAARRGLSKFGDRTRKGRWTCDMFRPRKVEPPKPIQKTTPNPQAAPKIKKETKPLTDEKRLKLEVAMNDVCNHQMIARVLSWIATDMLLKTKLGLPGDPYEIPRKLLHEMQNILPKMPKQLNIKF